MPKQIWIVLFMNTVFSSILAFSNIYINIFLWNQGKSLADIGIYNAFVFVFIFVGALIGAYIMTWVNSRLTFVLSSVALTGVFLFLISQQESIIQYIIPLGALYGTALGLYYSGFNLYSILLTNGENRQLFMGMEQITNRLTLLIAPVLFSFLILQYDYLDTFRLILSMLFIQVLLSLFTPKYKSNFTISSLRYRDIWKEYRFVLISIVAFGFLQSIIQLAGSVLLFSYAQRETVVGWFNTLFALLSIITLVFLSRHRLGKQRMKIAFVGAVLATGMTILLFIPNFYTLIVFNLLAAIALPLIWIPVSVTHYGKIKELACASDMDCDIGLMAHYLIIREFMLSVGRSIFYVLLIWGLNFEDASHYIPVLFISLIIPLSVCFCNKNLFQEEEQRTRN